MNFLAVSIGRARYGCEVDLFNDYSKRIRQSFRLIEVENKKGTSGVELKSRESELLISRIPDNGFTVALDRRGVQLSSNQLAAKIQGWQNQRIKTLVFLIGGANGFNETVWNRSNFVLSLGPQTWPHLLVRVLIAEQIYRTQCILSGHPYHKS